MINKLFTPAQIEYIESINNDTNKTLKEKLELLYDYVYEAIQIADDYDTILEY